MCQLGTHCNTLRLTQTRSHIQKLIPQLTHKLTQEHFTNSFTNSAHTATHCILHQLTYKLTREHLRNSFTNSAHTATHCTLHKRVHVSTTHSPTRSSTHLRTRSRTPSRIPSQIRHKIYNCVSRSHMHNSLSWFPNSLTHTLTHSHTHSLCTLRTHLRTRAGMQVSRSYIPDLFPHSQLNLFFTHSLTNSAQGCKCAASYTYNGAEMKGCIPAGEWVMSNICIESWYTRECVIEHMWLSHGVHMNESWHAQYIIHLQCRDKGLHCCRRVSNVTYVNESWHTYEWVMALIICHTSTMVPR